MGVVGRREAETQLKIVFLEGWYTKATFHKTVHARSCKHVSEPKGSFFRRRSPAASLRSATRWRSPNSSPTLLASLFVYSHTELVMGVGPPPSRPPPHYLFYLMGPLLFPHAHLFIYFFPSTLTLRVTGFNIVGETWLLPLNAEITGAFFLSSLPLHFSRVAPRGRNIFISPCAPSFKTFTPAVWKIFLIFLPHGVEKSP